MTLTSLTEYAWPKSMAYMGYLSMAYMGYLSSLSP